MSQAASKEGKYKFLVIDDHESVLQSTVTTLQKKYPQAEIFQVQTSQEALSLFRAKKPELVIVDLQIPEKKGEKDRVNIGIELLKELMSNNSTLNIVVQSAEPRPLIRLKPMIINHEGGFTVVDKSSSMEEMLTRVDWSLRGANYTPAEIRCGLEIKKEWLQVLKLAFNEGLTDEAIAKEMSIAERTVGNYWAKIRDALSAYPEEGKNLKIQTEKRAREEGLID
jgi:DNA-binding NarL/FixJ family response regulator